MALAGMPNPLLWGVMGGLSNFIPYLGAGIRTAVLLLVGFLEFESLGCAVLPAFLYLFITNMESSFITPALLGRRFTINPVIIFLSIIFWGWLWGALGVLLAVPIRMVLRVCSENLPQFAWFQTFFKESSHDQAWFLKKYSKISGGSPERLPEASRRAA